MLGVISFVKFLHCAEFLQHAFWEYFNKFGLFYVDSLQNKILHYKKLSISGSVLGYNLKYRKVVHVIIDKNL